MTAPVIIGGNEVGRLLGYARVSTTDQRLDMQIDSLHAARCDEIYRDHGVSGGQSSRPGLDALLAQVLPGDTVVVLKLDRLGRSVAHLADLLLRFRENGIHFRSLSEGIDTATPYGKLIFHIISAIAEFQRDLIRENTRLGMAAARKRGKRLGRPPLLTPEMVVQAYHDIRERDVDPDDVATLLGVARITLDRAFKRHGLHAPEEVG